MAAAKPLTEGKLPRRKEPRNTARARQFRRQLNLPEVLLWQQLRQEPGSVKFRRQHSIGDYFLDFYVAKTKTAIEVDGKAQDMGERPLRDEVSDSFLRQHGIAVVRIPATDILRSPEEVAEMLVRFCSSE